MVSVLETMLWFPGVFLYVSISSEAFVTHFFSEASIKEVELNKNW